MDIHEYTLWEVGYCGSLQDIANILEYPQEQVLFSGLSLPNHGPKKQGDRLRDDHLS